jgi:murein DD-endopeptidase MepM/ murein hydrolase activator NlpD
LVVFAGSIVGAKNGTWVVSVDGEPVAQVSDCQDVERVLADLRGRYGEIKGRAVDWARVKTVRARSNDEVPMVDVRELEERLADALGFYQDAIGLIIDGEERFVFADRATADEFLVRVKESYMVEGEARAEFLEEVRMAEVKVHSDEIMELDRAVRIARDAVENVQEYVVGEGDTLWDVARIHNLAMDELLASNPGIGENAILQIGDRLIIAREQPPLTVVTIARVVETREIPYRTSIRRDASLPAGQRKVLEPGVPGEERATFLVTRQNGRLVERERLDVQEVRTPVTRVEVRGSKIMLASRSGSGQLIWPTQGGVISGFGMRRGRMHTGIDIAARHGTPVVAVEGGRVVRSGWHGGYGIAIDISHGSGVVTRYAHLSSAAVSVGQEVQRGQYIGAIGSTGNSTGPHLHFEVIVGGRPQNPLNYL